MHMRTVEVFARDVTMLRADGKGRADRKIGKVKILGNPPDHEPGTLPVFQPFTQETMEYGTTGVESLQ